MNNKSILFETFKMNLPYADLDFYMSFTWTIWRIYLSNFVNKHTQTIVL